MTIRQKLAGRSAPAAATLALIYCTSMTMLFAKDPLVPVRSDSSVAKFPQTSASANTKLTYKIIDAPHHTYGYNIFAADKLMIHQTSIPALPGNEGFKTKGDTTKVALLVIEKIKKGEMPPTVSIDEMKKLSVVK